MSNILIVEDNAESRYMLKRLLESKGHSIITAENGEDALRRARRDPPEVIVSDIMMPVMNGFRLCREVKNDSRLRNIPFIFYTATFVEEADEKLAMSLGASRFIVKPTEGEKFMRILDEVLEERRQGTLKVPEGSLENEDILLEMYDNSVARKLAVTVEELQNERKALIESEQRLKEAQELAHIGHWELDLKSNFLRCSDEIYRILGLKPQEFDASYEAFMASVHPDDRAYVTKAHKASLKKKTPYNMEYRLLLKEGTVKHVNERLQTVYDDDGMATFLIGTVQDITERKRGEEALRENEERYKTLFEEALDGICIADAKTGVIIDCNQALAVLVGRERAELIGQSQAILHPPHDDQGPLSHTFRQHLKNKEGQSLETQVVTGNGTIKEVEIKANPLDLQGRKALQGVFHDITERKRSEEEREKLRSQLQQAQKMEAIGTLAGGIAHDFNNILGAIIGYTEIAALQVPKDNKVKESLKEVLNAGRRARDLVKQILAFSRKGEQERIPIQIGPIVKEALKLLRSSLPTTVEIRQNIKGDTGIVEADPIQIHQVLMNLCANASHAMREKGGILEVEVRNVEVRRLDSESGYLDLAPGVYVRLSVCDTGQGMTPEVLERIFEPYYTTKDKGEGTGLGLSVAHGIVKNYGGTIRAYSELGKGSTFHVYLPAVQKKVEELSGIDEVAPIPTGKEHILFIDDEPTLVEIGKQMLERLAYKVTTRTSSIEALELFKAKPDQFDLVITDMTMPHMTGESLAAELMKIRSDIPVIICTGFSVRISEEKAKAMGVKAFVMKPLVMRDLAETVREVVEGKKLNIYD
jgi:PAS domain S-box-containing protein